MTKVRLGGATLNQTPLDWTGNTQRIIKAINSAKDNDIEILCLPELTITGYGCEDLFLSEWLYEKAWKQLEFIVPVCKDITVAVGLPINHNGFNYNCSCVIEDGEIAGIYAKQNMALDGVHYEPRWFTPWPTLGTEILEIGRLEIPIGNYKHVYKGVSMAFEICEDAWRIDRPAIYHAKENIQLILNPSASHFAFNKTVERQELVINSSVNFNCTYVYANLLGNEAGRMIYDGEVMIAHHAKLMARNELLSFKPFEICYTDVDFDNTTAPAGKSLPSSPDKNEEFVQASALALFDYLRKSRSHGFTLSLSGGADSSTIAVLVAEMVKRATKALGVAKFISQLAAPLKVTSNLLSEQQKELTNQLLICAYQGTKSSSQATLNAAKSLANDIGASFYNWTIDDEVASYTKKMEQALQRKLSWEMDDIALQNIQARSRSPIIWMMANIKNHLLLTTSNRSEGDVGYVTMDGDTSGSISPIASVDKHFITNWLKWAETALSYASLKYVNALNPTAELRPQDQAQTDEKDLMPYAIMVAIERLAIKSHKSPIEVFEELSKKNLESDELLKGHITKFYTLWSRNQWKRERIAPSFHLDDFNVDPRTWCRFPILSNSFAEELAALNGQ